MTPPRLTARDLIARADATTEPVVGRRHARPTRRLVLATGALALVAGVPAVVHTFDNDKSTPDGPQVARPQDARPGLVLVPIAYQFDTNPPAAGDRLRALADRLVDARYDGRTGRYMYHHKRTWGDPIMGYDRYQVALAHETKVWQAADGSSGKQVTIPLEPQYPDEESRDYWQNRSRATPIRALHPTSGPSTLQLPPEDLVPLPSDRARLRDMLKVEFGAGTVSKEVSTVYGRYVVPRQTRAEILRILADVPGFVWRGEVTDRAGRAGVAITFDDREHDAQHLLIFNPTTGELLAHELLRLSPVRISAYHMILGTDWTDQLG